MRRDLISSLLLWVEEFIVKKPHLKKGTVKNYRGILRRWTSYLEKSFGPKKTIPLTMKQKILTNWIGERSTNHSVATMLNEILIIADFLNFLENKGILGENPLRQLQKQYPKRGITGIALAFMKPTPQTELQNLKVPPQFGSPLGTMMKNFITFNQAQGKVYQKEKLILQQFDRFLTSYSEPPPEQLSDAIIRAWLARLSHCDSYRQKTFEVIRLFCLYFRRSDSKAYVPDLYFAPSSSCSSTFLPYIFSKSEIDTILKEAYRLKPVPGLPHRPQLFYVFLLLLYTTGMRRSEAQQLQLKDIDWKNQSLFIRRTKFFKSRIIPLSPSMMKELTDFAYLLQKICPSLSGQSFLFANLHTNRPYSKGRFSHLFCEILRKTGIKPPGGRIGPRLHDMRHTMAVHRLEEWYRQGDDVQSKLPLLSTYLGHLNIGSTQRYLTMTTELLSQASQRFNQYFISTPETKGEL